MKKLKVALAVICLSAICCIPAYANSGAISFEDLQQVQETQIEIEEPQGSIQHSSNSAIDNIAEAARLDSNSESVNKIGRMMNTWAAKLMQLIGYIISIGLGLVTAIDACYLAITPLQAILANGHKGSANSGVTTLGPQGPMMGAPKGPGLGPNVPLKKEEDKIQFVSQEALDAVEEGKSGKNVFKIYFKKRWMAFVLCPVIFVLAATGVLSQFGFMLGEALSAWIGNIAL